MMAWRAKAGLERGPLG